MMNEFGHVIGQFPDKRTGQNTTYCLEDVAFGAFSVLFTQSASFLAHQLTVWGDYRDQLVKSSES